MRKLIAFAFIAVLNLGVAVSSDFERYGSWGNEVTTGDENTGFYASGFILELFRHDGKFVGYLMQYISEPYDPPMGRLENLKVDESTGEIYFETKMSLYIEGPTSIRNSKDLYRFKGKIEDKKVVGTLDSLNPETRKIQSTKEVVLVGMKGGDIPKNNKGQHMTFEEWHRFKESLLKERGPKW